MDFSSLKVYFNQVAIVNSVNFFADKERETNVDSVSIGVGTRGNETIPGGTGKMYFDDILLKRSSDSAAE